MQRVATAVADGDAVDWAAVEAQSSGTVGEARINNLRRLYASRGLRRQGEQHASSHSGFRALARPLLVVLMGIAGAQVIVATVLWAVGGLEPPSPPGLLLVISWTFAAAAAVLLIAGRSDRRATPLAGLFLSISSAPTQAFLSSASALHPLPEWSSLFLPECFIPLFLWRLVREFPRVERFNPWTVWIERAGVASGWTGSVLFFANAADRLGLAGALLDYPLWTALLRHSTGGYWLLIFGLALCAPVVACLRLRDAPADERRRVRLFVVGLAIGVVPLFLVVLSQLAFPPLLEVMKEPRAKFVTSLVLYGFLLSLPLTTSYAVVAKRILRLRMVVHRAAGFALARNTLVGFGALPGVALGVHLWNGRALPLNEVATQPPAPLLVTLSILGAGLLSQRHRLLSSLERALLGSQLSTSRVLASLANRVATMRDLEELNLVLAEHARQLFNAETTRLYVLHRGSAELTTDAAWGPPLSRETALAHIAAAAPGCFSLDPRDRDGFLAWLPEPERRWAVDTDTHLIAPLPETEDGHRGILALTGARSGLPYATAEREAAEALAAAAALALDRLLPSRAPDVGSDPSRDGPAGECRACGRVAERPGGVCSCGAPLLPAAIPYRVAGKFELEALLGQGGMGVVYRATDLTLGREVALKTLPRLRTEALMRLRREARSMASFIHPALALIFGAETWHGVPILVVEYLPGGTLYDRLPEPLPPLRALTLGTVLVEALTAMHSTGFLHRDVKPSNVGYTALGQAKLLDFGLAQLAEHSFSEPYSGAQAELAGRIEREGELTATGSLIGTPLYLSPEALANHPASPAQDLWSLHLLLWETLAGCHPLRELPRDEALRQLAAGRIPDIRDTRPDCPPVVARLLRDGLDPEPARRPATAAQLQARLHEALAELA